MNISIIGTGYVGLVTGACLAEKGHRVVCVDVDRRRVDSLNRGRAPIFEHGLDELLRNHVGRSLSATTDLAAAVLATELTFICVGTPFNGQEIDLGAVLGAAREIGAALAGKRSYHVVVVKSTVVPGTTECMVRPALEEASGKTAGPDFGLGMNPEFLSEGQAVRDFLFPDRLVLGGIDERTRASLDAVYAPFADVARVRTNPRTAELIKYTSNALLATLISFANEIANLGAAIGGIDPLMVRDGLLLSHYFRGRNDDGLPPIAAFLHPGCGFGGSCLPKDVKALIAHGRHAGEPMALLQAVIAVNARQPERIVDLLERHWPDLEGRRIAVLGLAFKPLTNDVRESPAFPIVRTLLTRGALVNAYDPVANEDFHRVLPDHRIEYSSSLSAALEAVAAVIVVTPWPQFADLPQRLRDLHPQPVLIDSRRAYAPDSVAHYVGIGA